MRTIVIAMAYFFRYNWFFSNVLLLFRFYQLHGLKRKLFLAFFIPFCIDATYRITLQALGMSFSKLSLVQNIPTNINFSHKLRCPSLSLNETFLHSVSEKADLFVLPNDSTSLPHVYYRYDLQVSDLSSIHQRGYKW